MTTMGRTPIAHIDLGEPESIKTYTLRMDLNALEAFEEVSGKSLRDMAEGLSLKDVKSLLWACMLTEHPDMEPREVGKLVHIHNLEEVTSVVNQLFEGKNG